MNKEFVPYDIALALKELGFNDLCFNQYTDGTLDLPCTKYDYPECVESIPAPLYQQAFRWFREEHSLSHMISNNLEAFVFAVEGAKMFGKLYNSYEEAELACLKKLIELKKELLM